MSSNYIFDKASAQFERDFDAKLWIKRDLSHFIQKKKKNHGSLTRENSWKVAVNMTYPICLIETACTQQWPTGKVLITMITK